MRIPYTEVAPGKFRPLLAVLVHGPAATWLIDGLLDTGADVILLPATWATKLGLDIDQLPVGSTIQSATGQTVVCKRVDLRLEIRRDSTQLSWRASVEVPVGAGTRPHWGFKGFLEFFTCNFDGPNRWADLNAGPNLPAGPTPP